MHLKTFGYFQIAKFLNIRKVNYLSPVFSPATAFRQLA